MNFFSATIGFGVSLILSLALRRFYDSWRTSRVVAAWLNTLAAAFFVAYVLDIFIDSRAWYVELAMGFFITLILYSAFLRIYIAFLSEHFARRFPRRKETGNSWKIGAYYADLKERIEALGFSLLASSKTVDEAYDGILAYNTYFYSPQKRLFLSVEFPFPDSTNEIVAHFVSKLCIGDSPKVFYFLTRNAHRPMGLFAPDGWSYANFPMQPDMFEILKIHEKRVESARGRALAIDENPLDFVREMENDWLNANVEYGTLTPHADVESEGILTSEGKYRLWIESLLLTYFGYVPKC